MNKSTFMHDIKKDTPAIQALQEALTESAKDIDTIDSLLAYNNEAYFNIVRAISSELELN